MTVLQEFLGRLKVAEPQVYENLMLFPLIGEEAREAGYLQFHS